MDKKIIATYILRLFGVVFVLMYFFGHPLLNRLFPGFPVSSLNYFFSSHSCLNLVLVVLIPSMAFDASVL